MQKPLLGIALISILHVMSCNTLVVSGLCELKKAAELNVDVSTLKGCAVINGTGGFAVGENGVILEHIKGSWRLIDSPTRCTLNAVSMINGTFGFAVGSNGTILRYGGILWSKIAVPTRRHFYDVSIVHDRLGFAVGEGGLYRFDGEAWSFQKNICPNVPHIDMYGETFGVVVGGGVSYIYNGKDWSEIWIDPENEIEIMDVCVINDSTAFSVGFDVCKGLGVVYKFNGCNWNFVCGADGIFASISMIDDLKGFIAGYHSDGKGEIWKFDGLECSYTAHPIVGSLWDIKIVDAKYGFAVGNNATILKWNSESWTREIIDTGSAEKLDEKCILMYVGLASIGVIAVVLIIFCIKKKKEDKVEGGKVSPKKTRNPSGTRRLV